MDASVWAFRGWVWWINSAFHGAAAASVYTKDGVTFIFMLMAALCVGTGRYALWCWKEAANAKASRPR